jgi:heme-degrading monooxygenase HmoA
MKHVIVFRSRLRPGVEEAYGAHAEHIFTIAETMPGMLSARDYVADDGERVSIIEFDSAENLRRWREHPEHVRAQDRGRAEWYSWYAIQICIVERASEFTWKP